MSNSSSVMQTRSPNTRHVLQYLDVLTVRHPYGYSTLLWIAYTAVIAIFWFTHPSLGGTGFSPFMISLYMAVSASAEAIWLLGVFPQLHRKYGTGGVLNICDTSYPFICLQMPLLNTLRRLLQDPCTVTFWMLSPFFIAASVGVNMVFSTVQLAVSDISPDTETLGLVNALPLTISSGKRAFAPWLLSSLFTIGVRTQVLGGYLIWVVLTTVATGYACSVRWLPEEAGGKARKLR